MYSLCPYRMDTPLFALIRTYGRQVKRLLCDYFESGLLRSAPYFRLSLQYVFLTRAMIFADDK